MDFYKPIGGKKEITILNKNDVFNLRYGGDELSSYIQFRLLIQEKKTHNDKEILGNLAFVKINTDSLYILEPDDYIILRISKIYSDFTITSQEPEIHTLKLGQSVFLEGLDVNCKLCIEVLPFMPYKTSTGFSWILSHLALFYPITPPLRYYDPDFPFVSMLRAFITGQETDLSKLSDIFLKFQLKNYPSELFQPIQIFRDEGPLYNEVELDEGFLDKWMEYFSRETGFSYTIIYGIPFVDYSKDKEDRGLESVKSDIICFRADITFTQKIPQNIIHIKSVPYYLVSSTFSQGINVGAQIVCPCDTLTQIVHIVDQVMLLNTCYFLPVNRRISIQPRKIPLTFFYVSEKLFYRINVFHIQSPFYCLNTSIKTSENPGSQPESNSKTETNSDSKIETKSDSKIETKSDSNSQTNSDTKIENDFGAKFRALFEAKERKKDDPKIQMFYPGEAYMPAVPSFYPVGKDPKTIFVRKSFITDCCQIVYAEDWKGEFNPIIVSKNSPLSMKLEALSQTKWYEVIQKVVDTKEESKKEEIFNQEGQQEFPHLDFQEFRKIISVHTVEPERLVENFCIRNYRLVKLFNKQITKLFPETEKEIPMPINGLALVRVHQLRFKATMTNYANDELTIVNFVKKKPFGNSHIIESVIPSMIYKIDQVITNNIRPNYRLKKLDVFCEQIYDDPDRMIMANKNEQNIDFKNRQRQTLIITNQKEKPTQMTSQ